MQKRKKFYVVVYDIRNNKNREHVSKALEKYGVRVNFSVFECLFTEKQLLATQKLTAGYIQSEGDSVVYYPICLDCFTKITYQPKECTIIPQNITIL